MADVEAVFTYVASGVKQSSVVWSGGGGTAASLGL